MKTIKWLWSIAFAFMIVLFYATVTSFFVSPQALWYVALNKSSILPSPLLITIGWSMSYVVAIIILSELIYRHKNARGIISMIAIGLLQIIWSAVFFGAHSLVGGLAIEIIMLFVALMSFKAAVCEKIWASVILFLASIWYCIMAIAGLNMLLLNI